jgi:hypothetical protein
MGGEPMFTVTATWACNTPAKNRAIASKVDFKVFIDLEFIG